MRALRRSGTAKPLDKGQVSFKMSSRLGHIILAAAALAGLLLSAPALAGTSQANSAAQGSNFIQGKLDTAAGGVAKVASSAGAVTVISDNSALAHSLQDSRLNGREVRLEGERKPDGSFEVRHLFTVHDGKPFRLRYYCHVCNIAATEPGNCVCCQRPTELEEIPADEVTDDMVMVP